MVKSTENVCYFNIFNIYSQKFSKSLEITFYNFFDLNNHTNIVKTSSHTREKSCTYLNKFLIINTFEG